VIVFFSDRSIQEFRDGTKTPTEVRDEGKDSVNFAFCVPIVTAHSFKNIVSTAVMDGGINVALPAGNKIKIGNGTDELLKIIFDLMTILETLVPDSGVTGAQITPIKTQLQNLLWI
jgi:hypothetical protein